MRMTDIKSIILESLTMNQVMESAGIDISSKHETICPFHSEKTASFHVYGNNGHCFGCGWNGDLIKFEMDYYSLSFPDALKKLNDDFSLGLPIGRRRTAAEQMMLRDKRRAFNQRQAERRAKEAKREEHFNKYCEAVKDSIKYAPSFPELPWTDRFCEAMKNRDYYAYLVECDTRQIYREEKGC